MAADRKTPRFSVDVPLEVREQMRSAEDGVPDGTRARLLLEMWAQDEDLQRRVREAHAALLRDRYRLRHK